MRSTCVESKTPLLTPLKANLLGLSIQFFRFRTFLTIVDFLLL